MSGLGPSVRCVAERRTGTRRIAGTDWPVTNVVQRLQHGNRRPEWCVLVGLCNGACEFAVPCRTRAQALAELEARGGSEVAS